MSKLLESFSFKNPIHWKIDLSFEGIVFKTFLLFVFTISFTKIGIRAFGGYEVTISDICLLFLFFISVVFIKKINSIFYPYILAFIIFNALILLSGAKAINSRLFFNHYFPNIFALLIIIATTTSISIRISLGKIKELRNVMLLALLISAIPVYYQMIAGVKLMEYYDKTGWRYTFLCFNPNQFGTYCILTFLLITFITAKYFKEDFTKLLLFYLFYIPVILFSGSRTATILFTLNIILLLGMSFLSYSLLKKAILGPIIAICLLISVPLGLEYLKTKAGQINRALTIFEQISEGSTKIEGATGKSINAAIELFKDNPILGVGIGNKAAHTESNVEIHNTYLKFLAETGLVGMLGFLIVFTIPLISLLFSQSNLLIRLIGIGFYLIFMAMNYPHFLFRQRWVWLFMVLIYGLSRIGAQGEITKSKLSILN